MAQRIIDAQTAELVRMRVWRKAWYVAVSERHEAWRGEGCCVVSPIDGDGDARHGDCCT